ncbi:MAG: hypothetical protein HY591_04805 [Candidatus Omnitrophica bacterium]|nr:hypothetical protein [Candidatus Omnitrophota bacterium]
MDQMQERRAAINALLDSMEVEETPPNPLFEKQRGNVTASPPLFYKEGAGGSLKTTIHGEVRTSAGINSDGEGVFTRANFDLNERNWRMLSSDGLNRRTNTYDPALYSRVKVVMDAAVASSVSTHLNITADPWSYTGKTREEMVTDSFGDRIKVQYYAWGNVPFTVNRSFRTLLLGDGFNTPEIKIKKGVVPASILRTTFGSTFTTPDMKVEYTFFPLREAWVDIKPSDNVKLKVFPIGYEDQALTTDDPLRLSNNRAWWEESPWIRDWTQGTLNTGANPLDFTKGQWDRSLAFFTRDSDGQRLTALRGVSVDMNPVGETSLKAAIASPKTLWQEYREVTAVPASMRVKHFLDDKVYVGGVANAHQGFVNGEKDAENYVGGFDAGIVPFDGLELSGQYSRSKSHYDQTNASFASKKQGNAYIVSLEAASNPVDVLNKDYFGLTPAQKTDGFYKTKLFWARMDEKFESSLSNYHETRDDNFGSRHLSFYPGTYQYLPGIKPGPTEDDLAPIALGNGLDYGRSVIGWRADTRALEGRLKGLNDVRRVMSNKEKHLETEARTQWDYELTSRLRTKALFVWDALPKTRAELDPFVVSGDTGEPLINTAVRPDKNPSVSTGSLGARYQMSDWAAINGVWEYTNDSRAATDNFPNGILNDASFATYTENGRIYRKVLPFLYDQGYFDQPPYDYFNIFKTGLELTPNELWHIYLDYTRNPNKFAGNVDDNMNHYGIEADFSPTKRLGFFARYTLSRGYDIDRLVYDNLLDYKDYYNFFFEARWLPEQDTTLSLRYGVGPYYDAQVVNANPYLTYYTSPVLQIQHILRLTYQKKF